MKLSIILTGTLVLGAIIWGLDERSDRQKYQTLKNSRDSLHQANRIIDISLNRERKARQFLESWSEELKLENDSLRQIEPKTKVIYEKIDSFVGDRSDSSTQRFFSDRWHIPD